MKDLPENLEELLRNAEKVSSRYEVEIYATPRTRRERLWVAGYVIAGLTLLALLVVLPHWFWRLPCALAYLILAYAFDRSSKLA